MTDVYSRKITFTAGDMGSRTLELLLAFDFAKSNVQPLHSPPQQYPVVWKIMKFGNSSAHDVTYTNRLAFTKAETLKPPPSSDEQRWILQEPDVVQEVNASQETMLVQDPNNPEVYSFAKPVIDLHYPSSLAMNGVATPEGQTSQVDIAFGFYETKDKASESKPAQILSFYAIPQNTPVSLEFVPFLQAYFVPEGFYCEGEVLTMPIPSPVALQVDISLLKEESKYSVSVDNTTHRAIIKPAT